VQRINFWKIGSNCFDRIVLIEVRVYALRLWHAIEVGTCSWRIDVKVFCCLNLLSYCLVFLEYRGVHFGAHFANDTAPRKLTQGVEDNLHHVTQCREVLLCQDSISPLNLLRNFATASALSICFAISRLFQRLQFASQFWSCLSGNSEDATCTKCHSGRSGNGGFDRQSFDCRQSVPRLAILQQTHLDRAYISRFYNRKSAQNSRQASNHWASNQGQSSIMRAVDRK